MKILTDTKKDKKNKFFSITQNNPTESSCQIDRLDITNFPWNKKSSPREKHVFKNEFLSRSVVRALKNTSTRNKI